MMRTELTMDQMAQVNGGSYHETLEDAKQLTRRGLANMVYPAGYTKINNVANTWAPEITSILAAHGYRFVYNASMNGLNEYYDRDGQQVDRDTFWANFKW